MGRDAGFIALHAGVAGGADVILIPEIPFDYRPVEAKIEARARAGRHFSIVSVAEGAHQSGEGKVYREGPSETESARLGGVGREVGAVIEELTGMETRVTVLGHLQRGGSPTSFDRFLATRFGSEVVRLAERGGFGRMVAMRGEDIADVPLADALATPKRVDIHSDEVRTARSLGICMGDEEQGFFQ
jgi:6-phosphofructokinase 1